MRGGFFGIRRPTIAFPVQAFLGRRAVLAFPPHIAIRCERDVCKNRVVADRGHGVRVGLVVGAGHHAEVTRLRINCIQPSVRTRLHPCDVIADGPDFPAFEMRRRDHHGDIGLAGGTEEGSRDVSLFALRRFDADDQHVFGEPAFAAAQPGTDAECQTFFAEQDVAAIIRAYGDDRIVVRKVADEAVVRVNIEHAMQPAVEMFAVLQLGVGDIAHARHDAHAERDVNGVGEFDSHFRHWRTRRAHQVGHDVHRAAAHPAGTQGAQLVIHLGRMRPVVRRSRFFAAGCANESRLFGTRDVIRVRAMQITAGKLFLVQADQDALRDRFIGKQLLFFLRTVAPEDLVRLTKLGGFPDPFQDCRV